MTRGTFDLLFDHIVARLESYSAAQPPEEQFGVDPDRMRDESSTDEIASVYVYLGPLDSSQATSKSYTGIEAQYHIDMVVRCLGERTGNTITSADRAAGVRLRYLVQQVTEALFPSGDRYLGMPVGSVGKTGFRIEPFHPDQQMGERAIAAARMTLDAGLGWKPYPVSGNDLASINIDASAWSALIQP